jgi:exodeoxyribonuclease VIII
MSEVMVDLETLGNGSNAAIISIGACAFDPASGQITSEFYVNVEPQSCVDAGLKMDVSTVMWWMKQSDEARAAFNKPSVPLELALDMFKAWYPQGAALWGNGATFDNVILDNAFKASGVNRPWHFTKDRCYRTLKNLRPDIKQDKVGVAHNALDDAKYQALHACKLLRAVGAK